MIGAVGPDSTNPVPVKCSRAGCTNLATANVNWRNPRIHGPERVKVWLACADHADYLSEYLSSRGFPVAVTALGTTVEAVL